MKNWSVSKVRREKENDGQGERPGVREGQRRKGKLQGFRVFRELPYHIPALMAYLTVDHLFFSGFVSSELENIVRTL